MAYATYGTECATIAGNKSLETRCGWHGVSTLRPLYKQVCEA